MTPKERQEKRIASMTPEERLASYFCYVLRTHDVPDDAYVTRMLSRYDPESYDDPPVPVGGNGASIVVLLEGEDENEMSREEEIEVTIIVRKKA